MIVRRKTKKGYTCIANTVIDDPSLPYYAMALLIWMLARPDDWGFSVQGILAWNRKHGRGNGRASIESALALLVAAGYLYRPEAGHSRNPDGTYAHTEWVVYENPQDNPHHHPHTVVRLIDSLANDTSVIDTPVADIPVVAASASGSPLPDTSLTVAPTAGQPVTASLLSDSQQQINKNQINNKKTNTLLRKESENQSIDANELAKAEEEIKVEIGYDSILMEHPNDMNILDCIIHEMAVIESLSNNTIRIGKESVCREDAVGAVYALEQHDIERIINAISNNANPVKNLNSYIRKSLYNAGVIARDRSPQ